MPRRTRLLVALLAAFFALDVVVLVGLWVLWPRLQALRSAPSVVADAAAEPRAHTPGLPTEATPAAEATPPEATSRQRLSADERTALVAALLARVGQAQAALEAKERSSGGSAAANSAATNDDGKAPGLEKEYLRQQMREITPLIKECYALALAKTPDLEGKVTVRFSIIGDPALGGVVESSEVVDAGTASKHADLSECLRETVYALKLKAPAHGGRVTVTYPFKFAPRN